jgi:hypothetical protein
MEDSALFASSHGLVRLAESVNILMLTSLVLPNQNQKNPKNRRRPLLALLPPLRSLAAPSPPPPPLLVRFFFSSSFSRSSLLF